MEEYIAADPITFEHHALFKKLQSLSLDWRLNDPFASLVSSILKILLIFIVHIICIYLQPSGLVHTRASLCPRRILCKVKSLVLILNSYIIIHSLILLYSRLNLTFQVRGAWLLPPPLLPGRPAGEVREARAHRPHPHPLQPRLLCQSCSWQQVSGTGN